MTTSGCDTRAAPAAQNFVEEEANIYVHMSYLELYVAMQVTAVLIVTSRHILSLAS